MSKTDFWINPSFEPKRQFRFLVQLSLPDSSGGEQDVQFLAKSVDRPSYSISSNEHQFFNHTFYYPGRVTWNTIDLTLVDPVSPKTDILIQEIATDRGSNESKIKGEWKLLNSFFTDVNFGSHDYGSEDMVEVSVTVQYDWAEYITKNEKLRV